jgi:L-cysteine/cystine lyase
MIRDDDLLAAIRAALPGTTERVALNAGSVGPLPRAAAEAMHARVDESLFGARGSYAEFEAAAASLAEVRAGFAEAFASTPARVALTHSVTGAINLALGGLEFSAGDEVVTTDAEHPGLDEPLETLCRRHGVVLRRAAVLGVADAAAAVAALIGPRTRLVAVSHVLWGSGQVLDVARIAAAAHAQGALVLVDGAQSVGAVPVRPAELGVDLYGTPGQKWLLGPRAVGALWVREGLEDALEVAQPSYFSRDRHAPGEPLWPDARRYDGATLSTVAVRGMHAALRWRADAVGWDEGFARARTAAERCRAVLRETPGVALHEPSGELACLVTFELDGRDPAEVSDGLVQRGVVARWLPHPRCVRVSPGFWTSESDLQRLAQALRELRG